MQNNDSLISFKKVLLRRIPQQAHGVETTMYERRCDVRRRIDVDTTLFSGCVSAGLEGAPAFNGKRRSSNFGFEIV